MNTRQVSFAIQGMRGACAKYAVEIETALTQLDGIVAAHVNYATERATVVYDPARAHAAALVNVVRSVGLDTPLERVTLNVNDLVYATSARTIEKVLRRQDGVVAASVDLAAGRVTLEVFPERASRGYFERVLGRLQFHAIETPSDPKREFLIRALIASAVAFMLAWGAVDHLGIFAAAREWPAPIFLAGLAAFAMFGVGWPFYRRALAALLHAEFDASVLIALAAAAAFVCGVSLGLFSSNAWLGWSWFIAATTLTASWFLARGLGLWVRPRFEHTPVTKNPASPSTPQSRLGVISDGSRR